MIFWKKGCYFSLSCGIIKQTGEACSHCPNPCHHKGKGRYRYGISENYRQGRGRSGRHLGEKNHRAAQLSRIRSFIRCQEKAAEKEYLALGRYYYHNLRDKENDVTEAHCLALDEIEQRLDASDAAISSGSGSGSTGNIASSWTEQRLKRGDCLTAVPVPACWCWQAMCR